ncbi:phospholipase [Xanthomonas fragariae]|uniref:Phospholipase A1 n=1 Tax=Xanthomonas fragariae TaxID=48664 RepID=A0A1Y6HMS0_9XANT|nr:phospholipase [Xanthomonas fragariae]SMQ99854.1 phospholipase A [Xanthomonas fragariae]SMR02693.1 phospholipase [Xanthomonas fragariae]
MRMTALIAVASSLHLSVHGSGCMSGLSLNHLPNGREDALSRSWNRVILNIGLDRENRALTLRLWFPITEHRADANNSDIENHMGCGDAILVYNKDSHDFAMIACHSLRGVDRSHGSLQWGLWLPDHQFFARPRAGIRRLWRKLDRLQSDLYRSGRVVVGVASSAIDNTAGLSPGWRSRFLTAIPNAGLPRRSVKLIKIEKSGMFACRIFLFLALQAKK